MKVEKSNSSFSSPTVSESPARATANKSAEIPAQQNGVSVSLGSSSSQLRSLESSIASAPALDTKKIAEIKQAISEGRFKINSSVIAEGLINNVRNLISASQR